MGLENYRPNPRVVARQYAGCSILVHLGSNQMYELNVTGAAVWELLSKGRPSEAILRHLAERFDVQPERLAQQVASLLDELESVGMVRRAGGVEG